MPLISTPPVSPPPALPPTQGMAQGTAGGNPYNIDGRLDFGASGANFDFSGNPASLGTNYANSYMDALNLNAENYGNIMGGYNQTMNNQLGAQDQLNQGYTGLGNQVQGLLQGTDQAQMQRINNNYDASMGQMNQGATDRGLGNTTVTNALGRGIESDRAQQQTNVQNQFAQLQAGYMSNIGLAGLNQQGNNILQNTNQADRQLNFMDSVNAPYPNPALYAQLAQQYGQAQQGTADRNQIQGQLGQLQRAGQAGTGVAGLNAGGGGGVRQSAFGPSSGNSSTTPGYGPGIGSGGGIQSGAGGISTQLRTGAAGGSPAGGGLGATLGGAGGGYAASTPGGQGMASAGGGAAGGAYGPGGSGVDPATGYTWDELYGSDLGYDNSGGYSLNDLYGSDVTDPNSDPSDPNYDYYTNGAYDPTQDPNAGSGYDWSGYYGDTGGGYTDPGYTDPGYSLNDLYGSDVTGGDSSGYDQSWLDSLDW